MNTLFRVFLLFVLPAPRRVPPAPGKLDPCLLRRGSFWSVMAIQKEVIDMAKGKKKGGKKGGKGC